MLLPACTAYFPAKLCGNWCSRAGGFTPDAYLYGSEFTRESTRRVEQQRLREYADELEAQIAAVSSSNQARAVSAADQQAAVASESGARAAVNRLRNVQPIGRIVLDFKPNSAGVESVPDLALEDGDRFVVPRVPSSVTVQGQVYNANAFLYLAHQRAIDYLRRAGGPDREADKKRVFLLRADGAVISRQYADVNKAIVYPGDTIVVPPDPGQARHFPACHGYGADHQQRRLRCCKPGDPRRTLSMIAKEIQDDIAEQALRSAPTSPPELDLFALIALLVRNARFILGVTAFCLLVTLVQVLRAKPLFASTAVVVVPQGNSAATTLSAQLQRQFSTSDMLGGNYELYADMLLSRTVAYRILQDFNLVKVYGSKDLQEAGRKLTGVTKVDTQPEGIIRVTVQDTDPNRAADIANDYIHQLEVLNSQLVISAVGQERLFLEREMVQEKDRLADAEVALAQVQEHTSGLNPESQATAALDALTTTRAQLRADQVRLGALLTGATEQNPEAIRLHSEIASLQAQVQALQSGSASAANGLPTSKVPRQELEYTRRLREVKFHESLFNLLEGQYESAKQQEAKSPTIIQVLDKAIPATHKSWPPRTIDCLMSIAFGFVIGLVLVTFKAFFRGYFGNPRNAEKLRQLKDLLKRQLRFARA